MTDELEFLVREQLLTKSENKYQTAFEIISKEEQRKNHENNRKVQKPLTEKICELIDTYIREDGSKVNYSYIGYEAAKWALIIRTFDWLQWSAYPDNNISYPPRPDDGAWTLTGYETVDWEKPMFVGNNGYLSHDKGEVKMDINFGQFKFFYKNIQEKPPIS